MSYQTSASAPKRHKRNRSADLMELDQQDPSYLEKMCKDLQKMKNDLEQDHMLVKALDPAVENVNSVLESLKHIDEYKKMPHNKGIKIAVRFSCFMYLKFDKATDLIHRHYHSAISRRSIWLAWVLIRRLQYHPTK